MANKLARAFQREGNLARTENNAITHASTLNKVLDFFYHAPTRQGQDNMPLFVDAYQEDKALALKALFYLRDVRQGKGQRQTFRDILQWLAKKEGKVFDRLVPYVPEYGRWDDLTSLVVFRTVQRFVKETFFDDFMSLETDKGISLLGKWLPSENASSKNTKDLAVSWAKVLELTPKQYRQALSRLREQLRVVERQMSAQEWDEINYEHVPSRASKLYPHELSTTIRSGKDDKTIEAMWQNLPNYFGEEERQVLVVVDTTSSMNVIVSGRISAMDVSVGLGLYCAQRNQGAFHNYVLTFNDDSHLVKLKGKNLKDDVFKTYSLPWGGSTNLQSAFNSILKMAVENNISQEDMPTDILVISDMEFNQACTRHTNLEHAKKQYKDIGYVLPRITFWNVNSRNNQVPATQDEDGVLLVSGFSAETIGKVLQSKTVTPQDLMLDTLNSERYAFVDVLL